MKDLRKRHSLTKESMETLIQNVVLSEVREQLKKDEDLEKDILERRRKDVKNFIKNYVDGIVKGEILNTKGKGIQRTVSTLGYSSGEYFWNVLNISRLHGVNCLSNISILI